MHFNRDMSPLTRSGVLAIRSNPIDSADSGCFYNVPFDASSTNAWAQRFDRSRATQFFLVRHGDVTAATPKLCRPSLALVSSVAAGRWNYSRARAVDTWCYFRTSVALTLLSLLSPVGWRGGDGRGRPSESTRGKGDVHPRSHQWQLLRLQGYSDAVEHDSHTIGTMAGDNGIVVAPRAQ
ncbi:hypothetical protein H257_11291 [Aphanomyces astaci]|uniref:Uncharacterized protein n=1 Tax=Aphanomyces astaci TaxID=112090 RepID=W4G3W7_APHAT|nr:hypothetical protein H257_11291 [Aphanomyces astaci]ETV73976.1 hypothetical protein H257_11291 [Aphanomyces astaci]|eukprot:XP_009836489.1 hypothetical protein H257_11291 [Aphanomyces astaci]